MANLSLTELAKMRRTIGDSKPDDMGRYDLEDVTIQTAYDDNNADWWLTAVDLLEQRWGIWLNEIDTMTLDGAGQKRNQKVQNIKERLAYAKERAGLTAFTMTVGTLDEGISQDDTTSSS